MINGLLTSLLPWIDGSGGPVPPTLANQIREAAGAMPGGFFDGVDRQENDEEEEFEDVGDV